ncbi:cupin domain-containing protein [Actinophytocola glycyrrhizae]|uniref:Cupin domain-containing protein n=1 Tax=Actinophytocola glycyrrhizae TaxID=2044873 RepID=A0ABV9SBW0_9PSEU
MRDPLPGAVGVSKLCVYDTLTPDGLPGGTPHLHLCCTEAYVVVGGTGMVQTLSGQDGFAEHDLRPGTVLWFTPGTVHRLVNRGGLEIVVLMANSGLPEAGDAVLTFPLDVVRDPARYAQAAALPGGGAPGTDVTTAYRRRDLAVQGFHELRDGDKLAEFHEAAVKLKQPLLDDWRARWERGAREAAERTGRQLAALAAGDPAHLRESRVSTKPVPDEEGRLGMCGLLNTYRYD